jgi:hypothetical protein
MSHFRFHRNKINASRLSRIVLRNILQASSKKNYRCFEENKYKNSEIIFHFCVIVSAMHVVKNGQFPSTRI